MRNLIFIGLLSLGACGGKKQPAVTDLGAAPSASCSISTSGTVTSCSVFSGKTSTSDLSEAKSSCHDEPSLNQVATWSQTSGCQAQSTGTGYCTLTLDQYTRIDFVYNNGAQGYTQEECTNELEGKYSTIQ